MSTEILYDGPIRGSGSPGTSDSGLAWFTASGTNPFNVSGGALVATIGGAQFADSMIGVDTGSTDNGVFATITQLDGSVSGNLNLTVRWNGVHAGNGLPSSGYSLRMSAGDPTARIYRNGNNIGIDVGVSFVAGDEAGIVAKGSLIHIFKNGGQVYTYTDASPILTGSNAGLGARSSSVGTGGVRNIRIVKVNADTGYKYNGIIGNRMPWHIDGSTGTYNNGSGTLTQLQMTNLNDELGSGDLGIWGGYTSPVLLISFPEPRYVASVFMGMNGGETSGWYMHYKNLAGTWTSINTGGVGYPISSMRDPAKFYNVNTTALGVGFYSNAGASGMGTTMEAFHIYGWIPQGAGTHRLRLWHPYLDVPLPGDYFDLDDIGRATIRYRKFRIKNLSSTLNANSISVDVQSPSYGATLTDQFGLRKDSDTPGVYVPTATLASLAPNTVSEIFEFRRTTTIDQAIRFETPFVRLQTGSFS